MTSTPTENRGQHERPQPIHEVPPELDESGAPYYIWPPFPRPAPGVEIIPFKDFTPKGIQIRMDLDDDDGVEYDGEGIPTVTLRVKHSSGKPNVDGERPKKKRKNKSKGKKANGGATRTDLWKEWQEGEDLRSKYRYDLKLSREDRFIRASEDFKRSRPWRTEVGQLYDQLRVFLGLIGSSTNPFVSKFKKTTGYEEPEDDPDSDDDINMTNGREVDPTNDKFEGWNETNHESAGAVPQEDEGNASWRTHLAKEAKMEAFLNDPHKSIRVYLTSHARDRGFYWSEMKLRDAPLLVSFFIGFLVRNNALPECQQSLKDAMNVVDLAKKELPCTKVIATAIPDEVSLSFTSLFGSQLPKVNWPDTFPRERTDDDESERENKKARLDSASVTDAAGSGLQPPQTQERLGWFTIPETEDHPAPRTIEIDEENKTEQRDVGGATGWTNDSSWFTQPIETGEDDIGGWGSTAQIDDGWVIPTHSLLALLGPTTIPLTHAVGYVEESVRQIISWSVPEPYAPGEATTSDPFKSFVAVELGPYKPGTLSEPERTSIQEAKLLKDPNSQSAIITDDGQVNEGVDVPVHDPTKDPITVLMLHSTAEILMKGIGINATWIQVAPKTVDTGVQRSMGKGKGKDDPQVWWYMEQIVQVLPSFWEELPASSRNKLNGRGGKNTGENTN